MSQGDSETTTPQGGTVPTPEAQPGGETGEGALSRALAGLLSRHGGNSDAVALHLLSENRQLREERRTLRTQLPAQGARVLSPEEAAQFDAYRALDADPQALRGRLEQGTQAAEREQARQLAEVSGANADVLSDRLRASGFRAEVREVQRDGQTTRAVHLLNADGQDQGELGEYARTHWAAYVPALFPQAEPPRGTVVTPQAGGGGGNVPQANPITAALAHGRPAAASGVVSAFDFAAPAPTGGTR